MTSTHSLPTGAFKNVCMFCWVLVVGVIQRIQYMLSDVYLYLPTSTGFFLKKVLVCRYMYNWAKTVLKEDIRDGWITENLLRIDNPSCTLVRRTLWFSNSVIFFISTVTPIASSLSAQLLCSSSFCVFLFPNSFFSLHSFSSSFPAHDFAQTVGHSGCLGNVNRISNGLCISTIPCLGID